MKSYNTIFYLLFVLLIMGAFASMAQNTYGLRLLGGVSIVFGMVFLYRLLTAAPRSGNVTLIYRAELLCLSLASFLVALRIFHIYFPFLEVLFSLTALVLAFIYGFKMIRHFRHLREKNSILSMIIFIYYFSLLLFIISMAAVPYLPQYSKYMGIAAFTLLLAFLTTAILSGKFMIEGNEMSVFNHVFSYKDNSILLQSLFFIVFLYFGLTKTGMLPAMYSDDFPQTYFKLVSDAESGQEKPVDGKYKHEEFKARYEAFVEKNAKTGK